MDPRFFRAAALCFAIGLLVQATQTASALGEIELPAILPDAMHLLVVGTIGFALLGLLSGGRVTDGRKGPVPRAFWLFAIGVVLRAFGAPFARKLDVLAAAMLAAQLLEVAAVGVLVLTAKGPSGTQGPAVKGS